MSGYYLAFVYTEDEIEYGVSFYGFYCEVSGYINEICDLSSCALKKHKESPIFSSYPSLEEVLKLCEYNPVAYIVIHTSGECVFHRLWFNTVMKRVPSLWYIQ